MGMRLRDVDAGERAQLIRIAVWFGGPALIMLSLAWFSLIAQQLIPLWLGVVLLLLDLPFVALAIVAIHHGVARASSGLVNALYAVGDIAPPRTYPRQDVLIVRGQYREAADYFRDHLMIEPDDNEARFRLADLLERHLGDGAGAERLYLEVRRTKPDRGQELRAANGLIDLYRKLGRRDRLMVELARFAERFRGSPGAKATARLLREMKEESSA